MSLTAEDTARTAQTSTPILDVLAGRWSPRSYDETQPIDETKLRAALEAARWSPSANNVQSWRFIVARRGSAAFEKVAATLMSFNAVWAPRAAVLLVAVAELADEEGRPRPSAIYDLGQAMAHLSVQAHHDGLHVHQMTGFVTDDLVAAFGLPANLVPVTVAAIGVLGSPDDLDEVLAARERGPRTRKPLDELLLVDD